MDLVSQRLFTFLAGRVALKSLLNLYLTGKDLSRYKIINEVVFFNQLEKCIWRPANWKPNTKVFELQMRLFNERSS